MTDYEEIGFKCGLEIHRQLETHKLFCNCPAIVHDENPTIFFERKLRAVAGESGKVDAAALHEITKNKTIKYEACETSSCLVDMDEQPPKALNQHALHTALMVAKLLNAKVVDQVQVMRKIVVDGSNVSGFQRTMLVATDGYVETSKGKVNISSVCLEEEAAKKVKTDNDTATYRLDRLGVPLIEIATDASIKDPEHAKETASVIGMILKSTGRVKGGIGTIRQDVNVSIKGKSRVEIKGFQDLRTMPLVIENEIIRQVSLKETKPEVRKANPNGSTSFLRPMPGAARMYPETDVLPININEQLLGLIEIPELISEKALKYEKKYNLNPELAKAVVEGGLDLGYYTEKLPKVAPSFIVHTFINSPKEIRSRHKLDYKFSEEDFLETLTLLNENKVNKEAIFEMLVEKAKGNKINLEKYKKLSEEDLEEGIKKIAKANQGVSTNALMGEVMKRFRGKVDGKKVMEILRSLT
ncbi:MAG: Glu-tRNA(Gln) amidotransferase subunit GatE [archaeon]